MLKRLDENWRCRTQFRQPLLHSRRQNTFAFFCQTNEDMSPGARPLHEPVCLGTIDKFSSTVVAHMQLLGKNTDRGFTI